MALGKDEIENRFGHHVVSGDMLDKHEALRGACVAFAEYLDMVLPDGRTKDVTLDQFKTATMWSHFALAELSPVADPATAHARSRPVPVPPRRAVPQ